MNRKGHAQTVKDHDRHLKKLCEHCNQMLSYTAYRSHKIRYYNESTKAWLKQKDVHNTEHNDKGDDINTPLLISMDTTDAYNHDAAESSERHVHDDANQPGPGITIYY